MNPSLTVADAPFASIPTGAQRAARGNDLSCVNWKVEAPLRLLMNNLDPEVAEDPDNLIVYGGSGKAARNWKCFQAIVGLSPSP